MDKGYHKIFWGLILLSFHINLGPIQIVPGFVSWIIILTGIEILQQGFESQGFNEGSRYAKILLFISIVGGLISLFGGNALNNSVLYSYLPIVTITFELLFAYKILEGSIEALKANDTDTEIKVLELENNQKVYTILHTIGVVGFTIAITFNIRWLLTIIAIYALFIRFFLMGIINSLKKIYLPPAENEQ
jgi:hypothetical protein